MEHSNKGSYNMGNGRVHHDDVQSFRHLSDREEDLIQLCELTQSTTNLTHLRKHYIACLHKYNLLYLFDDDAQDIAWDCNPLPNDHEISMLNYLTSHLYNEELFTFSEEI